MIERNDSVNVAALDTGAAGDADRIRESVSALFDGEASELELRRLLGSEPAGIVHGALRDYQLQRDALQDAVDMRFAHIDLSSRVRAALAAEDAVPAAAVANAANSRWWRSLASMAVAASVATVVVIGARGLGPMGGGFETGRDNAVAQSATPSNRATLGRVAAGVQPFGPLAAGNGLPGTVFPRNEVVGNGFPAAQTVSFDADQQRSQRYLMRPEAIGQQGTANQQHAQQHAMGQQGVINFAKVRLEE